MMPSSTGGEGIPEHIFSEGERSSEDGQTNSKLGCIDAKEAWDQGAPDGRRSRPEAPQRGRRAVTPNSAIQNASSRIDRG